MSGGDGWDAFIDDDVETSATRDYRRIVGSRTLWTCDVIRSGDGMDGRQPTDDFEQAILVASLLTGQEEVPPDLQMHMPVLDLDFPCRLLESSSPGHFHLYIDKAMEWRAYQALLAALAAAGLIEAGFHVHSVERGMTMLLRPGLRKEDLAARGVQILTSSGVVVENWPTERVPHPKRTIPGVEADGQPDDATDAPDITF